MRIAIFDYAVVPTNPAGGCHSRMIKGLCHEHEFTVFAVKFENPCPGTVRWVRVPVPLRPAALTFVAFQVAAPICYAWERIQRRARYGLVQFTETNIAFGSVSYAHFCFRAYLKRHWAQSRPGGLRRFAYWLALRLRAAAEPHVFRRAKHIVTPSQGLARELAEEYPFTTGKIRVLPNPVDIERMRKPRDFDRRVVREGLGLNDEDVAFVFVALGAFERKGLPLLLEALRRLPERKAKLLVAGGQPDLVSSYRRLASRKGLDGVVRFLGSQVDVRPYLWAADAFVLPSHYEVFPLVALEAAAAGLPLLVTPLSGVEEFIRHGENGFLLQLSAGGITHGLRLLLDLSPEARKAMGGAAQQDVARYDTVNFVDAWRRFYREIGASSNRPCGVETPASAGTAVGQRR